MSRMDNDLFEAAKDGDVDRIKFLVGLGADINAKNDDNKTPLDVAKEGSSHDFTSKKGGMRLNSIRWLENNGGVSGQDFE